VKCEGWQLEPPPQEGFAEVTWESEKKNPGTRDDDFGEGSSKKELYLKFLGKNVS